MGNSHFRSNIVGHPKNDVKSDGTRVNIKEFSTVTVATLTATNITNASLNTDNIYASTKVKVGSGGYFKVGSHQYMFFGNLGHANVIEAYATAIDASVKGSVYFGGGAGCATPAMWYFLSDTAASKVAYDA